MNETRLNHFLGMLDSEHDGEVLNAARAMKRFLGQNDLRFHHLRVTTADVAEKGTTRIVTGQRIEATRLRDRVKTLTTQLETIESEKERLAETNARITSDLDVAKRNCTTLSAQLSQANQKLDEALARLASFEQKLYAVAEIVAPEKKPSRALPLPPRKQLRGPPKPMDANEFIRHCQRRFGPERGWQGLAATFLNINPTAVSQMRHGKKPVPDDIAKQLRRR